MPLQAIGFGIAYENIVDASSDDVFERTEQDQLQLTGDHILDVVSGIVEDSESAEVQRSTR